MNKIAPGPRLVGVSNIVPAGQALLLPGSVRLIPIQSSSVSDLTQSWNPGFPSEPGGPHIGSCCGVGVAKVCQLESCSLVHSTVAWQVLWEGS